MQEASLGQEPNLLQDIWEPTAFLGEVKAVGWESFPDASSTFPFSILESSRSVYVVQHAGICCFIFIFSDP